MGLRRKNKLMRAGRVEEAGALATNLLMPKKYPQMFSN